MIYFSRPVYAPCTFLPGGTRCISYDATAYVNISCSLWIFAQLTFPCLILVFPSAAVLIFASVIRITASRWLTPFHVAVSPRYLVWSVSCTVSPSTRTSLLLSFDRQLPIFCISAVPTAYLLDLSTCLPLRVMVSWYMRFSLLLDVTCKHGHPPAAVFNIPSFSCAIYRCLQSVTCYSVEVHVNAEQCWAQQWSWR